MSEELRLLREAAERKAAYTLEWEQRGWGARRDLVQHLPEEAELPYRDNSYYIDKKRELPNSLNSYRIEGEGEGRGTVLNNCNYNIYIRGAEFRQLKGLVLFLQSKLNEHLDRHKKPRGKKLNLTT